jgi:hypothetical protein
LYLRWTLTIYRHASDEAIAEPRHRLNVKRTLGWVSQGFTQAFYYGVQAGFKVDKGVGGPKSATKFFARHQLSRMFQELQQDHKGLFLNLDADAISKQFVCARVNLECAEAVHQDLPDTP